MEGGSLGDLGVDEGSLKTLGEVFEEGKIDVGSVGVRQTPDKETE